LGYYIIPIGIIYTDNQLITIFAGDVRVAPVNVGNSTYWKYEYSMKDHTSTHFGLLRLSSVQAAQCQSLSTSLGNVRVVFAAHSHGQPELLQQTSYYPFGMTMQQQNFYSQNATENRYLYNSKELQDDQLAGNTLDWYDYGARFYDATLGRWHVVDPLAEKYYPISPYAYVANNPLRYIDPDGNEIVDANGEKINYDAKNGWSSNATNSVKIIHAALMLTETGRLQWEKAYSSESKIEMNIVEEKLYSQKSPGKLSLGQTNQALGFDLKTARNVKMDNVMQIKISTGSISESFDGKNKGLTLLQAIGATAGHEIEHTTEENRDIGIQNLDFPTLSIDDKGRDRIEIKPGEIGRKIREESRNSLKSLDPIKPKVLDSRSFGPSQGGFY
jgi:RHS repeat-associated protein